MDGYRSLSKLFIRRRMFLADLLHVSSMSVVSNSLLRLVPSLPGSIEGGSFG